MSGQKLMNWTLSLHTIRNVGTHDSALLLYWRWVFQFWSLTTQQMQWTCGQLIVKIKHYSEWHFLLLNSHYSCLLPVLGLGDKFNFDKDKCCLCPSVEALRERIDWLLEEGYSPLLEPGSKLKGSFLSLSVTLSSSWPGVMIETGTSKDTRER